MISKFMLPGAIGHLSVLGAFFVLGAAVTPTAAGAQSAADFYKKLSTITLAVGSGTGGSHDLNARIMAHHLGKYLPGKPSVVVQNVPGAGSLKLANQMANTAPKDGSYIAALNRGAVFEELYSTRSRAKFDATTFNWLGGPDKITAVGIAWHTAKVKTAKDLLTHQLIVGGSGGTTESIPRLLEKVAGMKFKVVAGYKSGGDVDLAIERGEVEGRAAIAWGGLKSRGKTWIDKKLINILFQTGLNKHPDLANVPLALDFATKPEEKKMTSLFFSAEEIGYPYAAPPGVPADRLALLRDALIKTMRDPAYIAEATKQRLDIHPISWQRMTKVIGDAYGAPSALRKQLQSTINLRGAKKGKKK